FGPTSPTRPARAGPASGSATGIGPVSRHLAGAGCGVSAIVGPDSNLPALAARRLVGTPHPRAATDLVGPRPGPSAPPRPPGPPPGIDRRRAVLVAPGRMVGQSPAARSGRAMLRRLGGLGPAGGDRGLRDRPGGNGGLSFPGPDGSAGGGERYRARFDPEKEINHDPAWNPSPGAIQRRRPGRARSGGFAVASAAQPG